jgi:starvation-inducible outer membrane lipoprotein
MFAKTLLLASACLLLSGCVGSMSSLIKRTPPQECIQAVQKLKPLSTGAQAEYELWVIDTTPKYTELRKNYECLRDWAEESDDETL